MAEAGYTDESDNSAVTLTEFAQMLGIPSSTAGMRLAALVRSGKAVVTKKVTRNGRGHRVQLRAYRLLRDTP